jgi:hypothetical protein
MSISTLDNWTQRSVALEPGAVVARDAEAYALARRLLDRSDEELGRLRGAISQTPAILVVEGSPEALPWSKDALYLGHSADAPALRWPIHLAPPLAPGLMERALLRQFRSAATPLVLVPQWRLVLPLGDALPLQRPAIIHFLNGSLSTGGQT